MHRDADLRALVPWTLGRENLDPIAADIERTWRRLRELRAQMAEAKASLGKTCPLSLTELEARFWIKVRIIDDDTSCWEWRNSRSPVPDNYGQFRWKNPVTGKRDVVNASRVALFLTTGALPDHACHTCDNPPCCRPGHLYDGTHQTNMRDRSERGRYGGWARRDQRGARNSQAKLTDELVSEARNLARDGVKLRDIQAGIGYQGNETVLRFAITGRTWKHLNDTSPPVLKR